MNQDTKKLFDRWIEDLADIQTILLGEKELTLDDVHSALRRRPNESPAEREKNCFQTFRALQFSKENWNALLNLGFIVEIDGQTKTNGMSWITIRLFFMGDIYATEFPDFDLVSDALLKHGC